EEEELFGNMTVESQRDIQDQPYVNNDDDRDIAICQRRPLNEYQQVHNRILLKNKFLANSLSN
ncbi:unnamed protein product, partial [Rotaria socialis]